MDLALLAGDFAPPSLPFVTLIHNLVPPFLSADTRGGFYFLLCFTAVAWKSKKSNARREQEAERLLESTAKKITQPQTLPEAAKLASAAAEPPQNRGGSFVDEAPTC